jgi:hypothetical protein
VVGVGSLNDGRDEADTGVQGDADLRFVLHLTFPAIDRAD